jgi:hypothetical protein
MRSTETLRATHNPNVEGSIPSRPMPENDSHRSGGHPADGDGVEEGEGSVPALNAVGDRGARQAQFAPPHKPPRSSIRVSCTELSVTLLADHRSCGGVLLIGGRSPQAHPHVGRGRRARPVARRQTCDPHPRARSAAHGGAPGAGVRARLAAPTERGALPGDLVTKVDRPEDGFLSTFRYQEPGR